jgi:hypothetical protein
MQITPELLVGLGIAISIALVLLIFRARATRRRTVERSVSRGPPNLRFTCAGCSEPSTHTKRTLGAWEKGTRRFYCNACHKKWRGSQPIERPQSNRSASEGAPASATRGREQVSSRSSAQPSISHRPAHTTPGSGCLGVAVLLVAVPLAVVFAIVQYA